MNTLMRRCALGAAALAVTASGSLSAAGAAQAATPTASPVAVGVVVAGYSPTSPYTPRTGPIINDPQVKSIFVNVFGGITACDEVANGIKGALEILGDSATKPLVVRLDGNNVDKGRAILDELNHPLVTQVPTMDGAADKAAELAAK